MSTLLPSLTFYYKQSDKKLPNLIFVVAFKTNNWLEDLKLLIDVEKPVIIYLDLVKREKFTEVEDSCERIFFFFF